MAPSHSAELSLPSVQPPFDLPIPSLSGVQGRGAEMSRHHLEPTKDDFSVKKDFGFVAKEETFIHKL